MKGAPIFSRVGVPGRLSRPHSCSNSCAPLLLTLFCVPKCHTAAFVPGLVRWALREDLGTSPHVAKRQRARENKKAKKAATQTG